CESETEPLASATRRTNPLGLPRALEGAPFAAASPITVYSGLHQPTPDPALQVVDGYGGVPQQVIEDGLDIILVLVQAIGLKVLDTDGAGPVTSAAFDSPGQSGADQRPPETVTTAAH